MSRQRTFDSSKPDRASIGAAADTLRRGGILLSPTDTVYGLGCDPFRDETVVRLCEIKGRENSKGFLLLIPDESWVTELVARIPASFRQLGRLWPGPVTFLFEAGPRAPREAVGEEGKIGLRRPAHPLLTPLLMNFGGPVLSTSANLSGRPTPSDSGQLQRLFHARVDLMLLDEAAGSGPPSSVVDLTDARPRLVRKGAWAGRLEQVLDELDS